MNICNKKQCIAKQCFCNLPMLLADHIELQCCKEAIYHVRCIINCDKCPYCLKKFTDDTIKNIQITETKVLMKLKKKKALEQKKLLFREEIKRKVHFIMLWRNQQKQNDLFHQTYLRQKQ